MTSLWQLPAAVLALLIAFTEGPGTLGTLSRRETLRRQMMAPSHAQLSNLSLPEPPPPAITSGAPPPATTAVTGEEPPPATAAAAAGGEAGQKPADPPKDEKFWRDRMTKARQALANDEAALPIAEGKMNGLTSAAISVDDPARQNQLRQQLLLAMAEVERLKAQIDADRQAIANIQAEARKAGIPPGWIRN